MKSNNKLNSDDTQGKEDMTSLDEKVVKSYIDMEPIFDDVIRE